MDDTEKQSDISNSGRTPNHPNVKVSAEQRKANSNWIRKRDQWRKEYESTVRVIRFLKREVRDMPTYDARTTLAALQDRALDLMAIREGIDIGLKATAYPYV